MYNQYPEHLQVGSNKPFRNMSRVAGPSTSSMRQETCFDADLIANDRKIENPSLSRVSIENLTQKRLSEYFKDTKKLKSFEPEDKELDTGGGKTLRALHKKYDNFCSQPIQVPATIPFVKVNDRVHSQRSDSRKMITGSLQTIQAKDMPIQKSKTTSKVVSKATCDKLLALIPKMIHLIGSVENIIRWNDTLKDIDTYIVYNCLGIFLNSARGITPTETIVFLKGFNGTVLNCIYYEIDRPLPKVTKGQFVACFGRIVRGQKYHFYNMDVLSRNELQNCQRVFYLSQRKVDELYGTHLKKKKSEEYDRQIIQQFPGRKRL